MKKLISIAVLILGVAFTSFSQDTIPVPDTLVYTSGDVLLINVISVKSDIIEYKKINDSINVFYKSLSSIKELRMHDGELIEGGDRTNVTFGITLSRRDSIRKAKNTKDIDKRKGHLLLTTNLTSLITGDVGPLELEGTVYENRFISVGTIYYPSSNFSVGLILHKGLRYYKGIFNSLNNPPLKDGVEINFGLTSSKNRRIDWGFRAGVSYLSFAISPAVSQVKKIYQEDLYSSGFRLHRRFTEESTKDRKSFIIPFIGFESSLKISTKFSLSSVFGIKYDVKNYVYESWNNEPYKLVEEYYDLNNVLINTNEKIITPQTYSKRLQDPKLFFRFSLNYHIIPKKK